MNRIRNIFRNLPTLLTAFVFALTVWIFAVTIADPIEARTYPQALEMDVIGRDPNLIIVDDLPTNVTLTIRAPSSIHTQLENDINLIDVTLDLSGLESGIHTLSPQVEIDLSPAEVVRINPATVTVELDAMVSESLPLQLNLIGNPAIGFEIQTPELSVENVLVAGPLSLVSTIEQIIAEVDIADVSSDVQQNVEIKALDASALVVDGISITPSSVQVSIPVSQRGGYRTVVVRIVTSGQPAEGFFLRDIVVIPTRVTIFSSDPNMIDAIPGFVETTPINLNGITESLTIQVALNLPEGINVVGSQNVTVQIGIEAIQGSRSFTGIPIQIEGLAEGLDVELSPEVVDVFLSGPISFLDALEPADILVLLDLTNRGPGTYTLAPEVKIEDARINVNAILPNSIEVQIEE